MRFPPSISMSGCLPTTPRRIFSALPCALLYSQTTQKCVLRPRQGCPVPSAKSAIVRQKRPCAQGTALLRSAGEAMALWVHRNRAALVSVVVSVGFSIPFAPVRRASRSVYHEKRINTGVFALVG